MKFNIAIIGAGVMGRTLAWQLLMDAKSNQHDLQITLFDKDPIESGDAAAYTAAGMLTPYCEVETAESLVFEMGKYSLDIWPKLVESLNADVDFHQRGSIVVAHNNDRADYQRFLHQLKSKLSDQAQSEYSQLTQHQLQSTCPELAPSFREGLYIPQESWVNSHLYMQAVAKQLWANGVVWNSHCEVTDFGQNEQSAFVVTAKHGNEVTHHFDQVIDCRGLNAKKDISDLRGVRGEVLTLHAPEVNIDKLVRLMHPRYRLYLVPRQNNTYLLGATQIESEDRGPITVRSALELLSAVYSLHTGFAEARVVKTDTNCRPALRDNLPRIDINNRVMHINGLFRHGYLLAPVIAEEASNCILSIGNPMKFPQLFGEVH